MLPDGRRTRTTARAAAASVARFKWARSCLSEEEWQQNIVPRLYEKVAGRGDLEMLRWLRDKGSRGTRMRAHWRQEAGT